MEPLPRRYNVTPDTPVLVGVIRDGQRLLEQFVWGLKPSWWKEKKRVLINARAETLTRKPTFRRLLHQRCMVPIQGFYEWVPHGTRRWPYFVRPREGGMWGVAGLWEKTEKEDLPRCVLITVEASPGFRALHPRMPALLPSADAVHRWLEAPSISEALRMLRPLDEEAMVWYPVSLRVNRPDQDDPGLVEPYQDQRA